MDRTLFLAFVSVGLFLICQPWANRAAQARDLVRIAPASNGVEIDELHITRRVALFAAPEADLTNMQLGLWFPTDWEFQIDRSPLIHIEELSAIEDDTGRVLSTEKRLQRIPELRGEVRGNTWRGFGGKQGPVVTLLLDVPARGAEKIRAIKGKARVTLTKPVTLTFKDLAAVNGKILDHPDMKELAALKLRFSLEEKDGDVSAKLSGPENFASPWNRGRLLSWHLVAGTRQISPVMESLRAQGGVSQEKTYERRTSKGLSLHLEVLEAVESKTFEFDFQNVNLP